MRVLVTGSTGFAGFHTVKALVRRGHQVVVFVRSQEKMNALFAKAGIELERVVVGDIADRELLKHALSGCDACVHTAAITPLMQADEQEIMRVNVEGTRAVIETARDCGVNNIVFLSSIAAVFGRGDKTISLANNVDVPEYAYGKSKALAELYVRQQLQAGVPIAVIYPGGIVGPEDPALSATLMSLQYRLNNDFTITSSGTQQLDVRDLADFIVAALERSPLTPAQYILAGHYLPWADFADLLERVSGAKLNRKRVAGPILRAVGAINDIKRAMGKKVMSPVSRETMRYTTQWPAVDNQPALDALNFKLRSAEDTFADTLRWMKQQQLISPSKVPAL